MMRNIYLHLIFYNFHIYFLIRSKNFINVIIILVSHCNVNEIAKCFL